MSTTVTAAVPGGVSASAGVTVAQQPRDVRVSPDQERFTALGDTLRLSGQAFDANGHAIDRLDFRWLSNNESVVTVDASGVGDGGGQRQRDHHGGIGSGLGARGVHGRAGRRWHCSCHPRPTRCALLAPRCG